MTLVPGLDLKRSGAAPVTDIGRSLKRNQPIVVIDAKTGKRQLIWSELNMVAKNPRKRTLLRPPGHRLARGPPLHRRAAQPEALERQHDQGAARVPHLPRRPARAAARAARPAHAGHLRAARPRPGCAAGELYIAWDFTIASRQGLTKRLLSIRDRSFAELGDRNLRDLKVAGAAPKFKITEARDVPGIGRRVPGRWRCRAGSTNPGCPPGGALQAEQARAAGAHAPATSSRRPFVCIVPNTLRDHAGATAAVRPRPVPGRTAVDTIALFAPVSNAVICGTNFGGMSQEDLVNDAKVSADLSRFPEIADRLQQGILASPTSAGR